MATVTRTKRVNWSRTDEVERQWCGSRYPGFDRYAVWEDPLFPSLEMKLL
ncbi:MAG: hypothetical protein FJY97_11540 [candidate division Zixibacteria bacterium]|nr:hypothetical protein [candidate division Zixibacteria bacterium]